MGKAYEKYILKDKVMDMKASEASKLSKEEDFLGLLGCGVFVVGFVFVVSLVALILWFNKLTIFISIVILLALGVFGTLSYQQYKIYKKLINKVNERLGNQEN